MNHRFRPASRLCAASVLLVLLTAGGTSSAQQAPQISRAEARAVAAACRADVQRLCAGVPRGEGRIAGCLHQQADAVSANCREALVKVMNR